MAKGKNRARSYESGTLAFFAIFGVLLITLGVLSLLSVVGGLQGAIFSEVKRVMQGLGGWLCLGVSVLLIWGGVIVAFSAGRDMPKRGFFLVCIIYLSALAIINLMSKWNTYGFMDYVIARNNAVQPPVVDASGFLSMLKMAYTMCCETGAFGGAIGMLLGWPAWTFLRSIIGTVVLGLICLICVVFFARFDLKGMLAGARESGEERRKAREAERAQQDYQRMLEEQQRMAEEAERLKLTPAYKRKGQKGEQPMAGAPMQPIYPPYGSMIQSAMQPQISPYGVPPLQPIAQGAPQPDMYDELVMPQGAQAPWQGIGKKGKKAAKERPTDANIYQTQMTFTPDEVGESEPAGDQGRTKILSGSKRKTMDRLEDIRRRKAELNMDLYGNTLAQDDAEDEPSVPVTDRNAAYKRPPEAAKPTPRQNDAPSARTEAVAQPSPYARPAKQEPNDTKTRETMPKTPYVFPSLDLLNLQQAKPIDTREQDMENAKKLEKTLESFAIPARVQRVTHGPAVTRFELGLVSSGVNVKRILSIADNIALDMAANGGVRIEIPIPGTNLFGIEVPNTEIQPVTLAEVLTSAEMQAAKSPLAVALGRDITGKPIICDLAKMPHLLIAGQTGSGKSVCINSIVNSLLFRSSPEEVRMIMIDPKVVELQCYNVVPHLLIPVVSDPHKAAGALAWAVAEMLDRYHKMQSKNARDISAYNAKLAPDEEKMPRIVIIIDELADLMLACKKEVEESIIRLAQLARAAGIHMVVATQRPTVDVITGLIKSNVPSRIAFAVSSNIDSRTILDEGGAEKLLGRGDMLYMPTGVKPPKRVQGCFLSDAETERVVNYIAAHSRVEFDPNVIEAMESEEEIVNPLDGTDDDGGLDERLAEAIDMVITDGQASISMLQRRMKIGYARAGRLIDDMAARGIVSKSVGSKPREVLMSREEYERIKESLLK